MRRALILVLILALLALGSASASALGCDCLGTVPRVLKTEHDSFHGSLNLSANVTRAFGNALCRGCGDASGEFLHPLGSAHDIAINNTLTVSAYLWDAVVPALPLM